MVAGDSSEQLNLIFPRVDFARFSKPPERRAVLLEGTGRMRAWRQFALVSILALCAAPAAAIDINDETIARNDRFATGGGSLAANTDPSFIGLGYDWSGVGWTQGNQNISFALVTP